MESNQYYCTSISVYSFFNRSAYYCCAQSKLVALILDNVISRSLDLVILYCVIVKEIPSIRNFNVFRLIKFIQKLPKMSTIFIKNFYVILILF